MIEPKPNFEGLNCTINTTEDCNLRCKYCYETKKRPVSIDFEKCKKFIDLVLSDEDFCSLRGTDREWIYGGRVFDFIGGDSLMDVELLDKILTYINTKWNLLENPPIRGWRASISSNGTLFVKPEVRAFCEKWARNLSLGVSIDGCPEIHDMNRVYPDGSPSLPTILESWDWYQKTFPSDGYSTKSTCSKSSIPYLYKSLVYMHEVLGIKWINQNFIMEDTGCTEEDYKELDRQLGMCVDYVFEHRHDMYWSMIDKNFFLVTPRDNDFYTSGRCGSGCMPALSIDGRIYPCFRWLPHTQNGKVGVMCVGDVDHGFNHKENFVAVQQGSIRANCTRDPKCRECEYEPCCSYCIGGCYAEYGDFIRTTHICEIIKLQCKWAKIYWDRYEEAEKN